MFRRGCGPVLKVSWAEHCQRQLLSHAKRAMSFTPRSRDKAPARSQLFDTMYPKLERVLSTEELQEKLLTKLEDARDNRNPSKIQAIMRRAAAEGQVGSPDVYAAAIGGLAECRLNRSAYELWDEMKIQDVKPNIMCYIAHFTACAQNGACKRAGDLLEEMKTSGLLENATAEEKLEVYNAYIFVMQKKGQTFVAEEAFRDLQAQGCQPDTRTFNLMMGCFTAKRSQWDKVVEYWQLMPKYNVLADPDSYGHMIRAYVKQKKYEDALKLFTEGRNLTNLRACQTAWDHALRACQELKRPQTALKILKEMKFRVPQEHEPGGPPALAVSEWAYARVISALGHTEDWETAMRLYYECQAKLPTEQLGMTSHNTIIQVLLRCGKEEMAKQLWVEALRKGRITSWARHRRTLWLDNMSPSMFRIALPLVLANVAQDAKEAVEAKRLQEGKKKASAPSEDLRTLTLTVHDPESPFLDRIREFVDKSLGYQDLKAFDPPLEVRISLTHSV